MHAWEGRPFDDVVRLAVRRDPKRHPFGLVTGRSNEPSSEVLQWFRHADEMAAFLWRMEPQRWGLRLGKLAEFKARIEPVIVQLNVIGPNEALRQAHNEISRPHFEVRWWGSLEALRTGQGAWAEALIEQVDGTDEGALLTHLKERFAGRREP
jgi:hypothetical protein